MIMTLMWSAIPRSVDRIFLSGEHDSFGKDAEKLPRPPTY